VIEQHPKARERTANYRLGPSPEEAVMHEEEIRSAVDCALNRPQRDINSGGDPSNRSTMIQLKSVQGHRVIRMAIDPEQAVEALREFDGS
jgi:uncharacterized protein (DUF3084 family)